jgi:hypothetical protein
VPKSRSLLGIFRRVSSVRVCIEASVPPSSLHIARAARAASWAAFQEEAKMRFSVIVSALSAVVFMSSFAAASEPDAKTKEAEPKVSFDAAPAFLIPVGNLSDAASVGLGVFAGARRPIAQQLDVTGRAGFVYHFSKDYLGGSVGISEVPILAGLRYTFVPTADGGLYGGAEIGMSIVFSRASLNNALLGGQSTSQTDVKASTTLGVGYQYGKLDARGALYFIDLGHMGDSMAIMATVGYSFAEL